MKRFTWLTTVVGSIAVTGALALTGVASGASAASSLPTLKLALTGTQGISVSGSTVSGAVKVVSTATRPHSAVGIIRLNPGVSLQQAAGAPGAHHGDLNALTRYATLLVSADAPSTIQTVLTPGRYVALNITGNGQPAFAQFTVTQSSAPAALPKARATETAIEFGFKGPKVLHNGTIVRAQNHGWLVHMITMISVRNAATGRKVMALLRAGKDHAAQKLVRGGFDLLGPASPGAMQQQVLHARPGLYIEACFMDTTDGREHTQLGMQRLIRVVK